MLAEGTFAGQDVSIDDPFRLASMMYVGNIAMPQMIAKTATEGELCGVILDPRNSGFNWDGWKAYGLTCELLQGTEIALDEVVSPDGYRLP